VRIIRSVPVEATPPGTVEHSASAAVTGTATLAGSAGPGTTEISEHDVQEGYTITTSLSEPTKRDAMWALFDKLASQVDDGKVQHIQLTVKATVPKHDGESLADKARGAGANPFTTEL
jgi:hypothetical protein